jgi:type II secretory pathway component PulK
MIKRWRTHTGTQQRPASGFALVIVLWVLAGLTVVAVAVASSLRTSAESVKLLRDRVRAEAAFLSTSSRVRLILATAGAEPAAYNSARGVVPADNRLVFVDNPQEWVQVLDLRAVVNLNRPAEDRLNALLVACGAATSATARLVDALLDYVDSDSLKRLNGAESFDYAGGDLPPPRNAPLLSRDEVWRVKFWPQIKADWVNKGCNDEITVHGDGLFNRNTASLRALRADGLDEAAAAALINARENGLADVSLQTVKGAEASSPFGFAGGGRVGPAVRMTHAAHWVEWSLEVELELTPSREGGPWRLHEVHTVPKRALLAGGPSAVNLPGPTYWNPDRETALNNAASGLPFGN